MIHVAGFPFQQYSIVVPFQQYSNFLLYNTEYAPVYFNRKDRNFIYYLILVFKDLILLILVIFVIDLDSEGKDIDLGRVFAEPGSRVVPSPPQRGAFFSRGSSVSVTTIRGADGVMKFIYFMYMNLSRNLID